jgi:hypothetical protein
VVLYRNDGGGEGLASSSSCERSGPGLLLLGVKARRSVDCSSSLSSASEQNDDDDAPGESWGEADIRILQENKSLSLPRELSCS